MTHAGKAGILAVRAQGGDVKAVLDQLNADWQGFKDRHQAEIKEVRAAADQANAELAALKLNGPAPSGIGHRGNWTDETQALAQYSRMGEVRADLSIGGSEPGDLSKGGAAVFPAISQRIMVRQFDQSAIARLARRVTIEAGSEWIEPQDLGQPGSAWVGETEARPALTTAEFTQLTVPVHEVYALQRITQRLIDDSQYDLGGWLAERIADKLARSAGEAFMLGDGDKKPNGLTDYSMTSEADAERDWGVIQAHYTGSASGLGTTEADILVDVIYSLRAQFRPGAAGLQDVDRVREGSGDGRRHHRRAPGA